MLEVVLAKFIIMRTILTVLRKNGSVLINLSLSSAYKLEVQLTKSPAGDVPEKLFFFFCRLRQAMSNVSPSLLTSVLITNIMKTFLENVECEQ